MLTLAARLFRPLGQTVVAGCDHGSFEFKDRVFPGDMTLALKERKVLEDLLKK